MRTGALIVLAWLAASGLVGGVWWLLGRAQTRYRSLE